MKPGETTWNWHEFEDSLRILHMWSESSLDSVMWHHFVELLMDSPEKQRFERLKQISQLCRHGKQGDFNQFYDLDILDFKERYAALREIIEEENEEARRQSNRS